MVIMGIGNGLKDLKVVFEMMKNLMGMNVGNVFNESMGNMDNMYGGMNINKNKEVKKRRVRSKKEIEVKNFMNKDVKNEIKKYCKWCMKWNNYYSKSFSVKYDMLGMDVYNKIKNYVEKSKYRDIIRVKLSLRNGIVMNVKYKDVE